MRIGLTGGVGSGKSTVAAILSELGAVVIDADAIAREVVAPGTPGLQAVVARFGSDVLAADGGLDRAALAAIVFNDEAALTDLNEIVHPLVGARSAELAAQADPDAVIVQDIPLLVENALAGGFDAVLVVEAERDVRLARLAARGMSREDAVARMAAQASDEQRRAIADEIIENNGSRDQLRERVEEAWSRLLGRRRNHGRGGLERQDAIG